MFKHKNALISIAVAMMIAACGGSSHDDNDAPNQPGNGNPTQPGDPGTPGTPGQDDVTPTTDEKLQTVAELSNVIFTDGAWQIAVEAFTSNTDRGDGTGYGAYSQAAGDFSPLKGFGYRLAHADAVAAAEQKDGRLAFELRDQKDVANGQVLQIEIDKIETSVDVEGKFSIKVADGAKVYVHATNEAGQKATVEAPATAGLISVAPGTVGGGDVTPVDANDITLNIDGAVKAAIDAADAAQAAVLASVKNFAGGKDMPMEMALTISNLDMTYAGAEAKGRTITVEDAKVPGVTGSGVEGFIQIEEDDTTGTPAG